MRRAELALLWMYAAAAAVLLARPTLADESQLAGAGAGESERGEERQRESEPDDDSDSAPFMVVVVHGNGQRCSGSLVSLRTALTSAWCVRAGLGGGERREMLALAPAAPPARPATRRVARVALAAGADVAAPPRPEAGWAGAALDIAVLELDAPFSGGTRSRPILMATLPEDCAAGAMCHVVRAVGAAPHLRIVDGALVPGDACGAVARGWPGLRDTALCLAGPTLCSSDRGAGVVCDGKLCGVLSRSALARNDSLEAGAADSCGDTHVAQSVARWRRFLHCAHTLRACGSGGECAQLCSERQLLAPPHAPPGDPTSADTEPDAPAPAPDLTSPPSSTEFTFDAFVTVKLSPPLEHIKVSTSMPAMRGRTRATTRAAPTHTAPAPAETSPAAAPAPFSSPRPSFEFEPNRADFKGKPARTSPYLKAGEYGDNAADYGAGAEDSAPEPGAPRPASASTRRRPSPPPSARVSALAAQHSAAEPRARSPAAARRQLAPTLAFVTVLIYAL